MNSDWEVIVDGVVYQWFAAYDDNGEKMVELVEVA